MSSPRIPWKKTVAALAVLALLVVTAALLASRGVSEGTELRLLTRAALGPSSPGVWGTAPLEGGLPTAIATWALAHPWGLGVVRFASVVLMAAGVAATYVATRTLVDAHAARISALVLATLPLYAMHAGSLLPEAITFAAGAITFACAVLFVRDETRTRSRIVLGAVATIAVMLGVATRGVLLGACVPLAPLVAAGVLADGKSRFKAVVSLVGYGAFVVLGLRGLGAARESAVTFDVPLATAVHELFPWSIALPLAWSSLARSARAREETRLFSTSVLVGLGVAYGGHLLAARAGAKVPFVAPHLVAMAVGLAARDADHASRLGGRKPSPVALLASLVFALLLARDACLFPDTSLVPYSYAKIPEPALARLATLVPLVAGAFVIGLVVLGSPRFPFARVIPTGTWFVGWGTAGALLFLVLHHKAVESALSPHAAIDAYRGRRTTRSTLAIFGVSETMAKVSGVAHETSFSSPEAASLWLGDDPSRYMVAKRELRAELNSLHRARFGVNLPEIGTREASDAVLFVGALAAGETSENPLDAIVRDRAPEGYFPAPATFSIPVDAVAVRIEDKRGRAVGAVGSGFEGVVNVVYRARGAVPAGYCSFVHVDVRPTRAAVEDKELAVYPTRLWRSGDFVVVSHPLKIPHGASAGRAEVGFGLGVLPCTDDRRAEVVSGRHSGNRVYGGSVDVR